MPHTHPWNVLICAVSPMCIPMCISLSPKVLKYATQVGLHRLQVPQHILVESGLGSECRVPMNASSMIASSTDGMKLLSVPHLTLAQLYCKQHQASQTVTH